MKITTDKTPVSFEKTYEFKCLIELLKEKYPSLTNRKIQAAIERCIENTESPRHREQFIKLLKDELGIG
jgi:hypothetical protein